jgi:hypothetical protein
MTESIITKSGEATKGGFQAIKKVEGMLVAPKRVASKFTENRFNKDKEPNDQAEVVLEDAVILEMDEGEPEPDLRDNKFTFWMNYAAKGKEKPMVNTFFVKGFMKSGELLDAKLRGVKPEDGMISNLYGTRVTIERKTIPLFKKPKADNPEEKEEVNGTGYVFVLEEGGGENLNDHIKKLVVGMSTSAAKRNLALDGQAKRHPEFKEALDAGTLGGMIGVTLTNGKFEVTPSIS